MMTRNLLVRCAPLAIAASGALFGPSAMAQDAVPEPAPIVLPPVTTMAPEPAPVVAQPIVLPEVSTVQAAPAVEPPAETPVVRERTAPEAASQSVTTRTITRSAPVAAPVADQSAATTTGGVDTAQAADTAPVLPVSSAQTAMDEPTPVARESSMDEALVAGLAGALGLAAVGGIAYASSRRRRRRDLGVDAYEPSYRDNAVVNEPASAPVIAEPTPAYAAPVMANRIASSNGDPVALPSQVPGTVEERVALVDRLVAAKPDKANPFASRKARAKRARMIVNSLGRSFTRNKPRIDLSEYTNRWPALRGWQPATA